MSERRDAVREQVACPACGGGGRLGYIWDYQRCTNCEGSGTIEAPRPPLSGAYGLVDYAAALADDWNLSDQEYADLMGAFTQAVEDVVDGWQSRRAA